MKSMLLSESELRQWARENYVPFSQRLTDWHPVILDEMSNIDWQKLDIDSSLPPDHSTRFVPVMEPEDQELRIDAAHEKLSGPRFLRPAPLMSDLFIG